MAWFSGLAKSAFCRDHPIVVTEVDVADVPLHSVVRVCVVSQNTGGWSLEVSSNG